MEKSSFKKRLLSFILFCMGALLMIRLLPYFYRCPFYALTGIPCPGCGMTRAFSSALKLDWRQAVRWNPMIYPFALCCLYAAACFLAGRGKQAASLRLWGVVAVLLLVVWLVRLPSIISGESPLTVRPGSIGEKFISFFFRK